MATTGNAVRVEWRLRISVGTSFRTTKVGNALLAGQMVRDLRGVDSIVTVTAESRTVTEGPWVQANPDEALAEGVDL